MTETASTTKLLSMGTNDASSDTDSIKSSSTDSDSDLEDTNLDLMSTSQFLRRPRGDKTQRGPILSDDHDSVPTITVIAPDPDVSYARESYSAPATLPQLPLHLTENQFVTVDEGDALVVIDESTDYMWTVKVCNTGLVGMLPAWNVEQEFERIARLNMEANCRVSPPVTEFGSPGGSPSSSEGNSSARSTPTTPSSTSDEPSHFLEDSTYVADQSYNRATKVRKVQGVKSVGFASHQVVFRYPSETYIHGQWDDSSRVEDRLATSAVWSLGWVEDGEDVMDSEASTGMKRKTRRGRKRDRRWQPIS